MKTISYRITLLSFVFALVAGLAFSQTASETSYGRAIQALNKGDCITALKELEQFKIEAHAQLQDHPDFRALIQKQIDKCTEIIVRSKILGTRELSGEYKPSIDPRSNAERVMQFRGF